MLYQADSRVNQLCYETEVNQLIVSSSTCTALLDFTRAQALKIGTKARSGPFGSTFYVTASVSGALAAGLSSPSPNAPPSSPNAISILSARPGNRIWVAMPSNASKVTQTLNFQTSLSTTSPASLFAPVDLSLEAIAKEDLNFQRLLPIDGWALLTWNATNLFFVDVLSLKIIQWYHLGPRSQGYIVDVATSNSHVYVLYHKLEGSTGNQSISSIPSTSDDLADIHSSFSAPSPSMSSSHALPSSPSPLPFSPSETPSPQPSTHTPTEPLLAHLEIDWHGMLHWCLNAGDWSRASLVLSSKRLSSLPLLLSVAPFLAKNSVDKNIANELGKLAQTQIERIERAEKEISSKQASKPIDKPSKDLENPQHQSSLPSQSKTLPNDSTEEGKSHNVSHETRRIEPTANSTDWSEFTQMPSVIEGIGAEGDRGRAEEGKEEKEEISSPEPQTDNDAVLPDQSHSLDHQKDDESSHSNVNPTLKASATISSANSFIDDSHSTPHHDATQDQPSPASANDVFDFGSFTAPASSLTEKVEGEVGNTQIPSNGDEIKHTASEAVDMANQHYDHDKNTSQVHIEGGLASLDEGEKIESSPALQSKPQDTNPTSSQINTLLEVSHDNQSGTDRDLIPNSSNLSKTALSPSLPTPIAPATSSSPPSASLAAVLSTSPVTASAGSQSKRKKKPRAVDIAAPSAKPPSSDTRTTLLPPSGSGSPVTYGPSGETTPGESSSPVSSRANHPSIPSNPSINAITSNTSSNTALGSSQTLLSASSSSLPPFFSSSASTPSTTPLVGSLQDTPTTTSNMIQLGQDGDSNAQPTPLPHTVTQWGNDSGISNPDEYQGDEKDEKGIASLSHSSLPIVPIAPVVPIVSGIPISTSSTPSNASPATMSPSPSNPSIFSSTALTGSSSTPPPLSHAASAPLQPQHTPVGVSGASPAVSTTLVPPPPSLSSSSSSIPSKPTSSVSTTAELKQLGREFRNKAKEGFKSFLSSLPSPSPSSPTGSTSTPPVSGVGANGSPSAHHGGPTGENGVSSHSTATPTPNTAHGDESTLFTPSTSMTSMTPTPTSTSMANASSALPIPHDALTRATLNRLQHYRTQKSKEVMTEAWIWPSLSRWLSFAASSSLLPSHGNQHHHTLIADSLATNPALPFHPSLTELLTACFEFQVSLPPQYYEGGDGNHIHADPGSAWSEEDAIAFLPFFLPHLRLSDILIIANARDWDKVVTYVLAQQESEYAKWRLAEKSEETFSIPSSTTLPSISSSSSPSSSSPSPHAIARFNDRLEVEVCLQEGNFLSALRKLTSRNDIALMLVLLPSLMTSLPKETLLACASLYPMLKPRHLLPLIPSLSPDPPTPSSAVSPSLELLYFKHLLEKSKSARMDAAITTQWLDLNLAHLLAPMGQHLWIEHKESNATNPSNTFTDATSQSTIIEGLEDSISIKVPLPGSLPFLQGDSFASIWSALKSKEEYRFDRKKALEVCEKRGFHSGAIFLLKEMGHRSDAIDLAIAIDDKETFEKEVVMRRGCVAGEEEWSRIVYKSAFVHNYLAERDRRPDITADMVVRTMTREEGARETVSFLTMTDLPSSLLPSLDAFLYGLTPSFFQYLLIEGEKGDERKRIVEKALKAVDAHLFTKKTPFYAAQLANVETIEKNVSVAEVASAQHAQNSLAISPLSSASPSPATGSANQTSSSTHALTPHHGHYGHHGPHGQQHQQNPLSTVPFFTKVETARGGSEFNPSFTFTGDSQSASSLSGGLASGALSSSSNSKNTISSGSSASDSAAMAISANHPSLIGAIGAIGAMGPRHSSSSSSSVDASSGALPPPALATSSPSSFFGDSAPHWGVRTHFSYFPSSSSSATPTPSPCPRCRLPLLDPRAGKLALFPNCSHAFHEMCVDEDACPSCLLSSLTSLAPPRS